MADVEEEVSVECGSVFIEVVEEEEDIFVGGYGVYLGLEEKNWLIGLCDGEIKNVYPHTRNKKNLSVK